MADFRRFIVENHHIPKNISEKRLAEAREYIATIEACIEENGIMYKSGDVVFQLVDYVQEHLASLHFPQSEESKLQPNKTVVYGRRSGTTSNKVIKVFGFETKNYIEIPKLKALKVVLQDSGLAMKITDKRKDKDDFYHGIVAVITAK